MNVTKVADVLKGWILFDFLYGNMHIPTPKVNENTWQFR